MGKQKKTLNLSVALHNAMSATFDVSICPFTPAVSPSSSNASFNSFVTADEHGNAIAADLETNAGTEATNPSDQPPQCPSMAHIENGRSDSTVPFTQMFLAPGDRLASSHFTADSSTVATSLSTHPRPSRVVNDVHPALLDPGKERTLPSVSPQLDQMTAQVRVVSDQAQSEYGTALVYQNVRGKSPLPGISRPSGLQPASVSGISITTRTTVDAQMSTYLSPGMFILSDSFTTELY